MAADEPIHQSDPDMAPDEEFVPGSWAHLVVGNEGRLLDGRRTPVRIVELCDRTGQFTVEILAFEDDGARWIIDYEKHGNFQFSKDATLNDATRVNVIESIARRLDKTMTIAATDEAKARTEARIAEETIRIRGWLDAESVFLHEGGELPDPETREGDPRLMGDLQRCMDSRGLWDMEDAFSRLFVSAPMGERYKGHRIVFAELGLATYAGKIIRDDRLFDAPWSRERRADHIITRMAFIRAMATALGIETFRLYRGIATDDELKPPAIETFVSATFSRKVAESFRDSYAKQGGKGILLEQAVPIERVFMTYLETEAMNRQFLEAEAVLLFEAGNSTF